MSSCARGRMRWTIGASRLEARDPEGFTVRCWVPIYGDLVC